MPEQSLLIATLVELADTLVDEFDVIDALTLLAHRCVALVDVDVAGVMLGAPGGELQLLATSTESTDVVALFQVQMTTGPSMECFASNVAIVNHHLDTSIGRWEPFNQLAIALGFEALHCFPMRLRGRNVGVLQLLAKQSLVLDPQGLDVARSLADIATLAVIQHQAELDAQRLNDRLTSALNGRIAVEQAKGMVAQATACGVDEAFELLRTSARTRHIGLIELAHQVVEGSVAPTTLTAVLPS